MWKTRKNVGDLHILIVDNFDFPRKIVKFCQNWIFGKKFDFSNSVDNFEKQKVIFIGCEDTKKAFKSTGSTSDDQDDGVGTACGGDVSARLAEHCTFFASAMQGEKFLFVLGTLNFFPNLL